MAAVAIGKTSSRCVLILGTCAGLVGCGSVDDDWRESEETEFSHAVFTPPLLTSGVFFDSAAIGRATWLAVAGPFLWIADGMGDPALLVVDTATGTLILSIGRKGQGPGEFSPGASMVLAAPGDAAYAVWAFDGAQQRIQRFEPRPPTEYLIRQIRLHANTFSVAVLDDRAVEIFASYEEGKRVHSAVDFRGVRTRQVKFELPGSAGSRVDDRVTLAFTNTSICARPNGSGYTFINGMGGPLEHFDRDGNVEWVAYSPFPSMLRVEEDHSTRQLRRVSDRSWYVSCSWSAENLFALFSGERKGGRHGRFLHVFDESGALRDVLQLDRSLSQFVVSERGDVMYARRGTTLIYRYDLPPLRDLRQLGSGSGRKGG